MKEEIEIFYPETQAEWREWLEKHHISRQSVWMVFYNKNSAKPSITWSEAVDVALCFGWIDSKKIKIDHETSHQFFCKRKAKSTWSKVNKQKTVWLIAEGLMTEAGLRSIEIARQNGSWTMLDDVEELIVPDDLERALRAQPDAQDYFVSLSKSAKKAVLHWLIMAKRHETRQKRIEEIVDLASKRMKIR